MTMTSREDVERQSVMAAQMLVDTWPLLLDGIDGMVRQTMERGFTEREARSIVTRMIAGSSTD